jgi:hypothetical protein
MVSSLVSNSAASSPAFPEASSAQKPHNSPSIRFGNQDHSTASVLPEWTKKVPMPAMTHPQHKKEGVAMLEAYEKGGLFTRIKLYFSALGKWLQLAKAQKKQNAHLPQQCKEDLKRYHRTLGYWFKRTFQPNQVKLMTVVYQGTPAIKEKQQKVQAIIENKIKLEEELKALSAADKRDSLFIKLLKRFRCFRIKQDLKEAEIYGSLLTSVPPLPHSYFEKQLTALKNKYNQSNPNDPIKNINKKAIKSGSIGQVYEATTENGKTLILKMVKPNLTEAHLNEYRPYFYYKNLIENGNTPEGKRKSAKAAQDQVAVLKAETKPAQEAFIGQKMRDSAQRLGLKTITVPDVLAHTDHGIVFPKVGEKDFSELSLKEQIAEKNKSGRDLAELMTLSPYKHLDIHDGNMRTGKKSHYLLDYGKYAEIPEANHNKLLRLKVAAYSAPKQSFFSDIWYSGILDPATRQQLKAFLEINPDHNKSSLDALKKIPEPKDLEELFKQESELKGKLRDIKHSCRVNPKPGDQEKLEKQLKNVQEKLEPAKKTSKTLGRILGTPADCPSESGVFHPPVDFPSDPSVFHSWVSAANHTPGFANTALSPDDVKQYLGKTTGFFKPFLEDDTVPAHTSNSRVEVNRKRVVKLNDLADSLTSSLLEHTGTSLDEKKHTQLKRNIFEGLANDLGRWHLKF